MNNGTFTIHRGLEWHTFRIRTQRPDARFKPGERIVSVLVGPRNTTDYRGIGTLDDNGFHIWYKWSRSPKALIVQTFLAGQMPDWDVDESASCIRCNRLLTTPDSIRSGIGPECAGRSLRLSKGNASILLAQRQRLLQELKEVE